MYKQIDVNDFCAVDGIATDSDAELLYQHLKSMAADDIIIVLNFANIKVVHLSFFKALLLHYFPDFKHLKLCNLTKEQLPLVKEALLCLHSRR